MLDFLTLGNRHLIDNPLTNKIAGIVALISVLILFIGVIVSINILLKKIERKNSHKVFRFRGCFCWDRDENKCGLSERRSGGSVLSNVNERSEFTDKRYVAESLSPNHEI